MRHLSVFSTAVALTVAVSTAAYAQSNHGRQSERQPSRAQNPLHAPEARYPQAAGRTENPLHAGYSNGIQSSEREDRGRRDMDDRDAYLQEQRMAQLRAEQEYSANIERERAQQLRAEERYRYDIGGAYRETSQYGADMLRQAVNVGYQQGVRAGERDRQNGWRANYENSPAYRDATSGYGGNYVGQSDYSYYFRQGFQRGYEDGYGMTSRYGRNFDGSSSMLPDVMSGILGLQVIR